MKIGIDIRNIGKKRTGDEVVFFNLTKNLAKIDDKNNYKLFTDITDEKIIDKIKKDLGIIGKRNFEVISLRTKNRFTWNFWALSRYLRKNPVDTYLTQYITPFFVPKKIKIATIIHDISFNFYPQFIKKSDLFFLKTLMPMSLRRADKIIAVSQFTRDEIINYYKINPEKIECVYNAVSEDFMSQDITKERIKKVREKYELPEKYILYIGTLQPRKNIPALIEALTLLKEDNDLNLVIAGGKGHNYDKHIDEMLTKSNLVNKVFFPGYIEEVDKATLLNSAQIFIFPSFYEGFGVPILEAMWAGVPVIISDIPPHREIAQNSAIYFDPENIIELAQKIKEVLKNSDLKSSLLLKGKEQVKKFLWKNSAQKIREIFERMA